MRVSTRSLQLQFLAAIGQRQVNLAKLQQQASSGLRVASAGDDPAAAVQIVGLQQALEQIDRFGINGDIARGRLNVEEQALNGVVNSLNRIRDLVIQARGPGRGAADFSVIGIEVQELFNSLLDVANSQDGEGRYLFSGNRLRTRPFAASGGSVSYSGDQGKRSQRISESRTIQEADSGAEVFQTIRDGNGTFTVAPNGGNTGETFYTATSVVDAGLWDAQSYTVRFTTPTTFEVLDAAAAVVTGGAYQPGDAITFRGIEIGFDGTPAAGDSFAVGPSRFQDVFTTVQNLIATLASPPANSAQRAGFQSDLNSVLLDLDQALEHVNEVRSQVGLRLAVLDEQQNSNEKLSIEVGNVLSRVRDVDFAAVISDLEAEAFGLEMAQRTFARARSRSLFELI